MLASGPAGTFEVVGLDTDVEDDFVGLEEDLDFRLSLSFSFSFEGVAVDDACGFVLFR